MSLKTAMNLALVFGVIVCGLIFVKLAYNGYIFTGILGGLLIGSTSGLMALGLLKNFLNEDGKALIRNLDAQEPEQKSAISGKEIVYPASQSEDTDVRLMFADGARLTVQQLGYFSFKWSGEWADSIIEEFAPGKIASSFPASEAITESPFLARIYLILFHATIYLAYVTTILRAPTHCISFFLSGLNDAIENVTCPNGTHLSGIEKRILLKAAANFASAMELDVNNAIENPDFNPHNTHSGSLLIETLLNIYPSSDKEEILSMWGISHLIDVTPFALMGILKDKVGLKLQ